MSDPRDPFETEGEDLPDVPLPEEPALPDDYVAMQTPQEAAESRAEAEAITARLYERVGAAHPNPRLGATRQLVEILGDVHRSAPVIHVAGTNGKTSTSRITESILRAHGLRTGLYTSPHLERVNERIVIDGRPISDAKFVENWRDIEVYVDLVDQRLVDAGEPPLTFFEVFTAFAFACFADAPVDVMVIEVGMGGDWDSTNVADGQVAVFTPVDLDHVPVLGTTIAEIARTKSGIVKPASSVVSAAQQDEALAELRRAADLTESPLYVAGLDFSVTTSVAVGGQLITVQGRAGRYEQLFLPLFGEYQAQNAALAIVATETFLGDGTQPLTEDVLAEGLAQATSPGRLQVVGQHPTVLIDAAHNAHGMRALAAALPQYFDLGRVVAVFGVLADKDAEPMVRALRDVVDLFVVTTAPSDRARDADELAAVVTGVVGAERVVVEPDLARALEVARDETGEPSLHRQESVWPPAAGPDRGEAPAQQGAVLAMGSITLIGEVARVAHAEGWNRS